MLVLPIFRKNGVWGSAPQTGGRQDSGVAADQTNAMLATSKEVIFSLCRSFPQKRATNGLSYCRGCLLTTLRILPQTAAQRPDRVNRVDRRGTVGIVTFGTAQLDEPLAVAAVHHTGNADFT